MRFELSMKTKLISVRFKPKPLLLKVKNQVKAEVYITIKNKIHKYKPSSKCTFVFRI